MKNLLGGLSIAVWEKSQLSRRTIEIQLNKNILLEWEKEEEGGTMRERGGERGREKKGREGGRGETCQESSQGLKASAVLRSSSLLSPLGDGVREDKRWRVPSLHT